MAPRGGVQAWRGFFRGAWLPAHPPACCVPWRALLYDLSIYWLLKPSSRNQGGSSLQQHLLRACYIVGRFVSPAVPLYFLCGACWFYLQAPAFLPSPFSLDHVTGQACARTTRDVSRSFGLGGTANPCGALPPRAACILRAALWLLRGALHTQHFTPRFSSIRFGRHPLLLRFTARARLGACAWLLLSRRSTTFPRTYL